MIADREASMTFNFLFRYRDLVGETLSEHQGILDSAGSCWWGWWKRPNEEAHTEVWTNLASEIENNDYATIGLFDTGTGTVRLARIDQIAPPVLDDFGNAQSVPPPDKNLVPGYYRNSFQSRAWFRLIAIDTTETDFFGEFAFAKVPELPNYPVGYADDRLTNKVIVNPDQLKFMDTTVWQVRPKGPDEEDAVFLPPGRQQFEALSDTPIPTSGDWILHLTDPHFCEEDHHAWSLGDDGKQGLTLTDAIGQALRTADRNVGAVVLTGDLTFKGSKPEFDLAFAEVLRLIDGVLSIGIEHLVVVPGNHDIVWGSPDMTYSDGSEVLQASAEATKNYRDFFNKLTRSPASDSLAMARRFVFPNGAVVDIAAVNSSSLEQAQNYLAGMGRVQEHAYVEASTTLHWNRETGPPLRILALHHHLTPVENLESPGEYDSGFGMAIDAAKIQRLASGDGVHVVLHGHKHRASLTRTWPYELPEHTSPTRPSRPINIVGGGSAGSSSVEGRANFFNLLRYSGSTVELETYKAIAGDTFTKIASWEADISLEDDGPPSMSEWSRKE